MAQKLSILERHISNYFPTTTCTVWIHLDSTASWNVWAAMGTLREKQVSLFYYTKTTFPELIIFGLNDIKVFPRFIWWMKADLMVGLNDELEQQNCSNFKVY